MKTGEEVISAAPTPNEAPPVADPAPTGDVAGQAPVEDEVKKERDRLAKLGREAATARRRAEQAEAKTAMLERTVETLQGQLQQLGAQYTRRQQQETEAYLASLPAEQRLERKIEMLQQRLESPAPAPQPVQQPDMQAVMRYKSQQILDHVNGMFDLGEDAALSPEDFPMGDPAWNGQNAFFEAARRKAKERLTMGKDKAPNESPKAPTGGQDVSEILAKFKEDFKQELGIGRPNSPRPAAGGVAPTAPGEIDTIVRGYNPRTGSKKVLEAARAAKDNALANIQRKR